MNLMGEAWGPSSLGQWCFSEGDWSPSWNWMHKEHEFQAAGH